MSHVFRSEKLRTFPSAFEADKKLSKNKGLNAKDYFQGWPGIIDDACYNSRGQNRGLLVQIYQRSKDITGL